nr:MAG TPA: hypothetical protein [Bacteriophage sp.]
MNIILGIVYLNRPVGISDNLPYCNPIICSNCWR